jgi:hypothetical protein
MSLFLLLAYTTYRSKFLSPQLPTAYLYFQFVGGRRMMVWLLPTRLSVKTVYIIPTRLPSKDTHRRSVFVNSCRPTSTVEDPSSVWRRVLRCVFAVERLFTARIPRWVCVFIVRPFHSLFQSLWFVSIFFSKRLCVWVGHSNQLSSFLDNLPYVQTLECQIMWVYK